MSSIIKILTIGLCLLSLSACKEKYTQAYYFSHPSVLKLQLQECEKSGVMPETSNPHCKLAYNTALRMSRLMQAFINNQTEFGQRIMRAQTHLIELYQQLQTAENAHLPTVTSLKKQIADAQQNVDNLRAIVGIFVHA